MLSLLKESSLFVYGKDFATPDGSAIRDYVHVTDLADAHVNALQFLWKNKQSLFLNLGVGKGISVLEMIALAEEVCKKKVNFQFSERREGDPAILIADSKKAEMLLRWKPQYSDPKTILESAWKWHQSLLKTQ